MLEPTRREWWCGRGIKQVNGDWWGEAPACSRIIKEETRVCHDRLSLRLRDRRAVVYGVFNFRLYRHGSAMFRRNYRRVMTRDITFAQFAIIREPRPTSPREAKPKSA
jgi:hypothetical protein